MPSLQVIQRLMDEQEREEFGRLTGFDLVIGNGKESLSIELICFDKDKIISVVERLKEFIEVISGEVDIYAFTLDESLQKIWVEVAGA